MSVKHLLSAAAIAVGALGFVGHASATTLPPGSTVDVGLAYKSSFGSIVSVAPDTTFSQSYDVFAIDSGYLTLELSTMAGLSITDLVLTLSGSATPLGVFYATAANGYTEYVNSFKLSAGTTYSLAVSGSVPSTFGVYNSLGTLSVTGPMPPVPEASSVAMTLAGLGVIGLIARRRKSA
ncbi:MAG: FxDxF family PEP-CTERM protein [Aquabacterium sp.]